MSLCRSCGAQILWARTEKGKKAPIDLEPNPLGTIIIREKEGEQPLAIFGVPDGAFPEEPRHTSHFATCPEADHWRHKHRQEQPA
jgi:hypothetical protein